MRVMYRIVRTLLVFVLLAAAGFAAEDFAETKKKAEAGDAVAQFNPGKMYNNGTGVPKDDAEAMKWWRKAAEHGHVDAQYYLGLTYEYGEGVPHDRNKAADLIQLAALQGNADAQGSLGLMYADGRGVPKNLVQAHAWLNISAGRGSKLAQMSLENIEKQMTDSQKEKAMDLARDLFAKLPKG